MALVVDLRITAGAGTERIAVLEVRRLTGLRTQHPADEVHRYAVVLHGPRDGERRVGEVEHRYGDGAWALIAKATEIVADQER